MSKKMLSILLALTILIGVISVIPLSASAETATSGTCGNYLTWNYDKLSGTLTINCTASYEQEMYNYSYGNAPWFDYRESIKTVIADDKVSTVGTNAFASCTSLESVYMPDVQKVGDYAFNGCIALNSVEFSSFIISDSKVGKYSFSGCSSLTKVVIPFREIGEYAFFDCESLAVLGLYNTTNIESKAFMFCQSLSSIYMINSGDVFLGTISNDAFTEVEADVYYNYRYFSSTEFSKFGGQFTPKRMISGLVGYNVYWDYDQTNEILTISGEGRLFEYSNGHNLPWWDNHVLTESSIITIIIEDGITEIPSYAFEYMSNVESVTLPNTLLKLYPNAFNDCKSLTEIVIPSSVEYIDGRYYWNRCSNLNDVYYVGIEQEWNEIYDLSNSYIAERITPHFLVYHPSIISCIEAGYPAHYEFDGTAKEGIFYDLNKAEIPTPEPTMIDHSFSDDWSADDDCHWHICTLCEVTVSDKADHEFDNTADSTYNVCGYVRVTDPYYLGDVNRDGEANVIDAAYIQRYDAGFLIPITEETILLCGDVDGDEEVGVIDVTLIQRYDAGFRVAYPIGEPI